MAAIRVEVVCALPAGAQSVKIVLQEGAKVQDALAASGLAHLATGAVGVFGRRVALDALLAEGDRVEIYRPLAADPKEARRQRARRAKRR